MAEPVKVIIHSPFWYLCDLAPGCLCSYKSIGNIPKYKIVPAIDGRAVLHILSDDLNEEKKSSLSSQWI
jgi:hypothetical protein